MSKILCAIRGGEASQRIQDIGINLAKERGEEIVFLYVVNTEFLDSASAALRESVTVEMEKLGEFLLLMAQERASKKDVVAGSAIRHGYLREELEAAASEPDISTILLGKPGEEGFFSLESLKAVAAKIEKKCQVEVLIC
jgi:nucleotide-binding universal stress UspA family protein